MTKKSNIGGDFLWGFILLLWIVMLVVPASRTTFLSITGAHPYLGGFFKFAILASMGDLLGGRILNKQWVIPQGFIFKAILWGLLGMAISLVFFVYSGGVSYAQGAGKLPFANVAFATAFFTSFIMNTTFGPMLFIFHKFGDLFIDAKIEKKGHSVKELVSRVDWQTMVGFSWLKTQTFVWIPCHTVVFLLPQEYRVLASAFLSIVLGILVAISKMKSAKK
ncbi:MAG: hypothetical protein H6Q60_1312 [Oscillospiraceae bacterium]|nr:hypothetical protein [Oscillospiraceae bacterium]